MKKNEFSEQILKICEDCDVALKPKTLTSIKESASTDEVTLNDSEINRIFTALRELHKINNNYLAGTVAELCKNPTIFNGKVVEVLTYEWLLHTFPQLQVQPHIDLKNCLKDNENGYDADGSIDGMVFDIKSFDVGVPLYEELRKRIQEYIDAEFDSKNKYIVTIDGSGNASADYLKSKINDAEAIVNKMLHGPVKKFRYLSERNKDDGTNNFYTWCDQRMNIIITATKTEYIEKKGGISHSGYYILPDMWAFANQYHFFRHGSQFCTNDPYMIVCSFDENSMLWFPKSTNEKYTYFRFLARRMFVGLTRDYLHSLRECDSDAGSVTIAEAARKISAILFVDVTKDIAYENFAAWLYLNPNADNKIESYIDSQIHNCGVYKENFEYDNY